MDYAFLKLLTETPGVPGREEAVRELIKERFLDLTDLVDVDNMGNLTAHIPGKGPKVALAAHMDEVGFIVSKIEEGGFLRVLPLGGIDPRVFSAQKVVVHGAEKLAGVVGSVSPHLAGKTGDQANMVTPVEENFIDLGLSGDEVRRLVRIGDVVTFDTKAWDNKESFFAKAIDDRVGLAAMLEAAKEASKIDCDLYLMATVQEERGMRGASAVVNAVRPDIFLALEGTAAMDTPGLSLKPCINPTLVGAGPEIRYVDRSIVADRGLVDFLTDLADKKGITYQAIAKNVGGTDAGAAQVVGGGAKVTALSVPVRYLHGPAALAAKSDIEGLVTWLTAYLEEASAL